jgi:hypothetical protein
MGILGKLIVQSEEELGKPKGKSVTPDGRTPRLGQGQRKFMRVKQSKKRRMMGLSHDARSVNAFQLGPSFSLERAGGRGEKAPQDLKQVTSRNYMTQRAKYNFWALKSDPLQHLGAEEGGMHHGSPTSYQQRLCCPDLNFDPATAGR